MTEHNLYTSLTTPRQYTLNGGWNLECSCGKHLGDTGDYDKAYQYYEDHVALIEEATLHKKNIFTKLREWINTWK
jgi:hypothetical protein